MNFLFLAFFFVFASLELPSFGQSTAFGWTGSGEGLSSLDRQDTDIWTGRSSWSDLGAVGWPAANADFKSYVTANPNGAVDFGTALIPHDLPSSEWNELLDEVVAGDHDSVFVEEGQNMAKYGSQTVYCRPWWEMTQDVSNLDPAKFQAAWNHAVPIIRAAFAAAEPTKTLKIVYCYLPNAAGDPKVFFPGPTNVDVIDADIYGKVWGTSMPTQAALLASVQSDLNYLATFAAEENKPMGISEFGNFAVQPQGTASNQGRGDEPAYIDEMFSFAQLHHFLYMVYFNIASGGVNQTLVDTPLSLARVVSWASSLSFTGSSSVTSQSPTPPLTSFKDVDIGNPSKVGSAEVSGDKVTVNGGGSDIWYTADQFNFFYQSFTTDQTIVAHVDSMQRTDPWWAKTGLMFRDSIEAGSSYVAVYQNPTGNVELQWRSGDGVEAAGDQQVGQNNSAKWLKLIKAGDTFTACYAITSATPNASDWVEAGSINVSFTDSTYLAGLAVTAHNEGALNTSVFSSISITGPVPVSSGNPTTPESDFTDEDIGDPAEAGSALVNGDTITIQGGGSDIWYTSDQFNYYSQSYSDDQTIVAHVDSLKATDPWWTKAGLMFRNSSSADAAYVALYQNNTGVVEAQWRDVDGKEATGSAQMGQAGKAKWLKLVKAGNSFAAYYANTTTTPEASDWILVITHTTAFTSPSFLAGLAVTAHNGDALTTGVFSSFSITPNDY